MTITVTNEEETGEVTLWAGTDALTMAPQVGDTITGAVMDPDGGVTVTSWKWAKSMTPDMMDSWMDITGATDAAYTVMEGDNGYYLRATAIYDRRGRHGQDGLGEDHDGDHERLPHVRHRDRHERMVPENTAAGDERGRPGHSHWTPTNDTLNYSLGGTDMASFDIDADDGQL